MPNVPIKERKWTQYIAVAASLIERDEKCRDHAAALVSKRTKHFYATMPPEAFVEVNRREWEELHTRLNDGVPVPKSEQLPYFFGEAADWCDPIDAVLGA